MERLVVYVASPLGFSDAGRYWLGRYLLPRLSGAGMEVINPWGPAMGMASPELMAAAGRMTRVEAIALGEQNIKGIRRSDAVLAVLDGADVDSGTAAEIGFAAGIGKRVVGYRGDFRLSSDAASMAVNLQVQAFIEGSGGSVHYAVDEAIAALKATKA